MPLDKSGSKDAFSKNVSAEMHAGKPQKQALAIAYSVARRAKKKADGGAAEDEGGFRAAYRRVKSLMADNAPFFVPKERDPMIALNALPARGPLMPPSALMARKLAGSKQIMQRPVATEMIAERPGFKTYQTGRLPSSANDPKSIFAPKQAPEPPPPSADDRLRRLYEVLDSMPPPPSPHGPNVTPLGNAPSLLGISRAGTKGLPVEFGEGVAPFRSNPWTVPGSKVPEMASGGGTGIPYYQASAIRGIVKQGLLSSPVPGRTDKLPIRVPSGAYVVPADVVSALGEGNTHAGGTVLDGMFSPAGNNAPNMSSFKPPRMKRSYSTRIKKTKFQEGGDVLSNPVGMDQDHPAQWGMQDEVQSRDNAMQPSNPFMQGLNGMLENNMVQGNRPMEQNASAGFPSAPGAGLPPPPQMEEPAPEQEEDPNMVPIIAAGGEYIISPDAISERFGDMDHGHKSMDAFVKLVRKEHIKTLKDLPGPSK